LWVWYSLQYGANLKRLSRETFISCVTHDSFRCINILTLDCNPNLWKEGSPFELSVSQNIFWFFKHILEDIMTGFE
jgi:hypothetical protein